MAAVAPPLVIIPLPPPNAAGIPLPPPPAHPPTAQDAYEAIMYQRAVQGSHDARDRGRPSATQDDLVAATVFLVSIMSARAAAAAAPPWFFPAMVGIMQPIHISLDRIENTLNIILNRTGGDEHSTPLLKVLFADGTDPVTLGLPQLADFDAINTLNGADSTAYCNGYQIIPIPHHVTARRRAIGLHVGCLAPFP